MITVKYIDIKSFSYQYVTYFNTQFLNDEHNVQKFICSVMYIYFLFHINLIFVSKHILIKQNQIKNYCICVQDIVYVFPPFPVLAFFRVRFSIIELRTQDFGSRGDTRRSACVVYVTRSRRISQP